MSANIFPWEIQDVKPEVLQELKMFFNDKHDTYVQVGPKRYFLPGSYREMAADIYNMQFRPDDVLVLGFPRSGTTRMRELVWIIGNDWNFQKASATMMSEKYLLSLSYYMNEWPKKEFIAQLDPVSNSTQLKYAVVSTIEQAKSPRFIGFHLPFSLVSPNLLHTSKVVYMARDPRDVAVSLYYLHRIFKNSYKGDFKTFWKLFINNLAFWSPYLEHVKEAWNMRHHRNLLFLFYEDVSKDLPLNIRKIASFLGKPCSEDHVLHMCEHLDIENFRKNKCVNNVNTTDVFNQEEQTFIRKGKAGGWRDYFDEEMTQEADRWMEHYLRDTDLRFPPT